MADYEIMPIENGIDSGLIDKRILSGHTQLGKEIINLYASYGIEYEGVFIPYCGISLDKIIPHLIVPANFNTNKFRKDDSGNFEIDGNSLDKIIPHLIVPANFEIDGNSLFIIDIFKSISTTNFGGNLQKYLKTIVSTLKGELYYFDDKNPEDKNIEVLHDLGFCRISDKYISTL